MIRNVRLLQPGPVNKPPVCGHDGRNCADVYPTGCSNDIARFEAPGGQGY